VSAEPATDFTALLDVLLRKSLDAVEATFLLVVSPPLFVGFFAI
jgi:hypothetical protein